MFKRHQSFRDKTLHEIRLWAWTAAVLPLAALAGLFFIWAFGTHGMYNVAMVIGSTTMFTTAVVWWWWALRAISTLLKHWDETNSNVRGVVVDVRAIRSLVRELLASESDK